MFVAPNAPEHSGVHLWSYNCCGSETNIEAGDLPNNGLPLGKSLTRKMPAGIENNGTRQTGHSVPREGGSDFL